MKFYESSHIYIEDDVQYTSATTLLKSYRQYVNWDEIAEKKAKKLGMTKEALLKQWADKRDKAAERGTKFHKFMEDGYISNANVVVSDVLCNVNSIATVDNVKEDNITKLENNKIYLEKMIWSSKYRICGTADLVEVVNGKINVKDYKTNEKWETESWKHPILGSKKLRYPVNSLDDCDVSVYELQVNLYMFMLLQKNRNLKIGNMELLHVSFDEDGKHSIKTHKVKNLQKEIKLLLEDYKTKKGF